MRWLWFAVILLWLPVAGRAEPVAIQTGEHATFTRVVLTIPEGTDWRLGRDAQGYVLRMFVRDGYDLDRFFELIPHSRIIAVSQDQDLGELKLAVSCQCNAQAFLFGAGLLVIDIRDGLPSRISSFELSIDPPPVTPARTTPLADAVDLLEDRTPYVVAGNDLIPIVVPAVRPLLPVDAALVSPQPIAVPGMVDSMVTPTEPTITLQSDALAQDLTALKRSIMQGLGQALTGGALSGELQADELSVSTKELLDNVEIDAPGLNIRSSDDPLAVPSQRPPDVTQTGETCLPNSYFQFADWKGEGTFFEQLGHARAAVIGEFDRFDETAVVALARLYVTFGFGREAVQTLSLDDRQSQERLYLELVARIVDDDAVDASQFFGQVSCPSSVALWAMLAADGEELDATVDRVAVLRSYKTLPIGLQQLLGPRLSERFLSIGDKDAAVQTLSSALAGPEPTVETTLVEVTLADALGETSDATEALTDLARSELRVTPEAMILFLARGEDGGPRLSDADFELADALRFENANQPVAADLAAAQIAAYLRLDKFDPAIALLVAEEGALGPDKFAALEEDILEQATARMRHAAFLDLIWSDTLESDVAQTQLNIAERLLQLGFAARARLVLDNSPDAADPDRRSVLLARAALALGETDSVFRLLDGDQSVRGDMLRDQASALREVQQAADVAAGTSPLADVDTSELLAWIQADNGTDARRAAASTAISQREVADLDMEKPLTDGRALLERSVGTRALLDGLLGQFQAPEGF